MSASRHADRRARTVAAAETAGLDGLLISPGPDLVYLVGHDSVSEERLTLLVLRPDADPVLVLPTLEVPAAETAEGIGGLELVPWADGTDPYQLAAGALRPGRLGISDRTQARHLLALQAAAAGVEVVPLGRVLPLLRAVKDEDEIARLRAAGAGADAAFGDILTMPFAGRRETEVAADLDRALREHGHDRAEFAIVASGPNAASPHHEAGERVIVPGDAVVLDFGGPADGYLSDLSRTVVVGEPDEEQRRVHEVVRAAQQAAFEAIRPGVAAQEVDRAARAVIDEAGYGDRFLHRTGHGIGLEVHEPPYIVEGDETPLEPGMTFSDEPGIYLPGRFGVRIEDQVVVRSDGAERLNEAPRDLAVVR